MKHTVRTAMIGMLLVATSQADTKVFYRSFETGDKDKASVLPYLPILERTRPENAVDTDLAKWLSDEKHQTEAQSLLGSDKFSLLVRSPRFEKAKVSPPQVVELASLQGKIVIITSQFYAPGGDSPFYETLAYFVGGRQMTYKLLAQTGLDLSFCGRWATSYDQGTSAVLENTPALALRERRSYCVEGDESAEPDSYRWLIFSARDQFKRLGSYSGKELPARLCHVKAKKQIQACVQ